MESSPLQRTSSRWTIALFALVVSLGACGSASEPASLGFPTNALTNDGRGRAIVTSDSAWPNDPLAIDSVRIEGDTLFAAVSHGGGCGRHVYQLVVGTSWMESFPVQAPGRVSHNANGDVCKALVRQELRISLTPLADVYRANYRQEHGTISLLLAGSSQLLWYRF